MPAQLDAAQIATHNRQFGYAGDIAAESAWELLQAKPEAVLVDVRTPAEWQQVGVPELKALSRDVSFLSWQMGAGAQAAGLFVQAFEQLPVAKEVPILLLCKSGGRSQAAAMALTAAGYSCCLNVAGGFEGPKGWREAKLPGS